MQPEHETIETMKAITTVEKNNNNFSVHCIHSQIHVVLAVCLFRLLSIHSAERNRSFFRLLGARSISVAWHQNYILVLHEANLSFAARLLLIAVFFFLLFHRFDYIIRSA